MPQSTVNITTNEQREFYYNELSKKVSDFKRFIEEETEAQKDKYGTTEAIEKSFVDIKRYLREAISFKNMFDIKSATFTLTRDDVDLLVRILNTSA